MHWYSKYKTNDKECEYVISYTAHLNLIHAHDDSGRPLSAQPVAQTLVQTHTPELTVVSRLPAKVDKTQAIYYVKDQQKDSFWTQRKCELMNVCGISEVG